MPSGEGVWWLTSKSLQPPSLLPFPLALAHFHLGQVSLEGGGGQSSIQSDYFGASVGLSSVVPSGLVTWASV